MKKILLAAIILLTVAGYAVGNYFVDFALKRGDDLSPPKATFNIADPNLSAPPAPNFKNEDLSLKSSDGLTLHAKIFYTDKNSNLWAILVHGYGRDGTFAYDYAENYLKHGWNVLIPDLRASGTSEGNFITMGALESKDIALWAEKIPSDAKIVLHGVSMGAATVLLTATNENIKNLCAVVEDCGYSSAYDMFSAQLYKIFGLPEYPVMPCANFVCKIKTGVKISDAAPINFVDKIKIPVLFIHGDADSLVPIEMMHELYEKTTSRKEKFVMSGAGHADSKKSDPNAYFEKIFTFLEANL